MVSIEDIRKEIVRLVTKYEIDKLPLINKLLLKYKGKENIVLKKLCQQYNEEYTKIDPLYFHSRYKKGNKIGVGAFSIVYECKNLNNNKTRALKVINKKNLNTNEVNILETEVKILRKLAKRKHKNIYQLHDVYESRTKMCLVLDLLTGGELFDKIISFNKFSELTASKYFKQIISALKYLHKHCIVHRDLKPQNLMLENDNIKIIDFGLAGMYTKDKKLSRMCGTPGYVAPEILLRKEYDTQVDMWSVGVILYIMLVGIPPFYDDNNDLNRLYSRIIKCEYANENWNYMSKLAKDLIQKLLQVNPNKRLTADQCLYQPWLRQNINDKNIGGNQLYNLRRFQYIQKLKRGVRCILAVIKLTEKLKELKQNTSQNVRIGDYV